MEALKEILYVSQSTIPRKTADVELESLASAANIKNRRLGICGSLIYSGHRFAQCLQGRVSAVDSLMQEIAADPRHEHVCVVVDRPIERCSYKGWGLHYSGRSTYVDRHIKAVMRSADGPHDERAAERLSELMLELAVEGNP